MADRAAPSAPSAPAALVGETVDQAALEDFLSNVVVDAAGCWLWRGEASRYGTYQGRAAHRASWELHRGEPIPVGLDMLHGCDVFGCVNPAHLRPGTRRENADDRARAAARASKAEREAALLQRASFPSSAERQYSEERRSWVPRPAFDRYWDDRHALADKAFEVESNAYERALLKEVALGRGISVKQLVREYARDAALLDAMGQDPFAELDARVQCMEEADDA